MRESNLSIATDDVGHTFVKQGLNHTFKKVMMMKHSIIFVLQPKIVAVLNKQSSRGSIHKISKSKDSKKFSDSSKRR